MVEIRNAEIPDFRELLRVFGRIGLINFGGPAGQLALMHHELVDQRRWISEEDYLHALNFCHFLPGPEAQQLATYIGWRLHGVKGGLAAGLLFVVPGALVILALSILYAYAARLDWFAALFLGIKAAVLAIVVQALIRIAARALTTPLKRLLAIGALVGLLFLNFPFPLIVLGAGAIGIVAALRRPKWLGVTNGAATSSDYSSKNKDKTLRTILLWLLIWVTPMALVFAVLGPAHILWKIAVFFSQLAVVTFGGAYAVLAYMAQEAVQGFGWLQAGEMADGLGLAETTPGPLIMVTQFVGFLAAFRAPEPFTPLVAGIMGAALTTWVTFAPCFLWIFTFAPWIERLQNIQWLRGGLAAITAAVVGIIGNLTIWFALHVLFARIDERSVGPVKWTVPDFTSIDWTAAGLTLLAAALLFLARWSILRMLALMSTLGLVLSLL